jgi:ribulose-phosphate 3-epimerase
MAAQVCPTITATDLHEFERQLRAVHFAPRIHVDLMDGHFAPSQSPRLEEIWLPYHQTVDIHLMYQRPMDVLKRLIQLRPHMVVIHNEVEVHHMHFAAELHKHDIKAGLAILQDTPIEWAEQIMHSFDQVLIFSGHLGYHGGEADLTQLNKVRYVREHHPEAEVAWDGGINDENLRQIVDAGVDVLNVGAFIQGAEQPEGRYSALTKLLY